MRNLLEISFVNLLEISFGFYINKGYSKQGWKTSFLSRTMDSE